MSPDAFEESLRARFTCAKCRSTGARVKSVAMSGTGLSRLLDFQYNKYVFVSCEHCGYTEVYDRNLLEGGGMDLLDILFGG